MSHFAENILARLNDVQAKIEKKYEFLASKCSQAKDTAISAYTGENQREAFRAMRRLRNYSKQRERMVKVGQALQKISSTLTAADSNAHFITILCHAVDHGETAVSSEKWLDRQAEATATAFTVDKTKIEEMAVDKVVDLILLRLELIDEDEEPLPDLFTSDPLEEEAKLRKELEQLVQNKLSSSLPGSGDAIHPTVTTAAPKPPVNQEEEDLQELEAWAFSE